MPTSPRRDRLVQQPGGGYTRIAQEGVLPISEVLSRLIAQSNKRVDATLPSPRRSTATPQPGVQSRASVSSTPTVNPYVDAMGAMDRARTSMNRGQTGPAFDLGRLIVSLFPALFKTGK